MTPVEAHDELLAYLARMEIPDCPCPRKPLPCGCPDEVETGSCDCPVRLPSPCEHMLETTHDASLEEWAEMLLAADEAHDEPGPPLAPQVALTRDARVDVMAKRFRNGVGLRHPEDILDDEEHFDHQGIEVELTAGNFRPRHKGIRTLGRAA